MDGFIKNFIIIGAILGVVFLSQQMNLPGRGKTFTFVNDFLDKGREYVSVGTNWLTSRAFPSIGGEAQKRGEMVAQGVADTVGEQKQKASEKISEKIKNYFSGITDAVLHPGKDKDYEANNNCDCPAQLTPIRFGQ